MKLIDNSLQSFRISTKVPTWVIWTTAIVLFCIAWYSVGVWARWAALKELSQNVDKWDDSGILEQQTNYTCVPSSLVMLLRDQGIDKTTYDIAVIAGTDIRGTGGSGVVATGKYFGFTVLHKKIGFDEFMERGIPGILIYRYKGINHAAYILGLDDIGYMQVKDSVQGLLFFDKGGAINYFESVEWDVYLFEKDST